MTDDAQRQLIDLLDRFARVRSNSDETFELASGEVSSFYFDSKRVTQSYEGVPLVGQVVWEFATTVGAEAVGGLAAGSISISDAAIAYAAFNALTALRGFYVLGSAKEHGTKERVYQSFTPANTELLVPGAKVLIVDDVMTSGGSLKRVIDELERLGAIVKGVMVLIDRQDTRAEAIRSGDYSFFAVAEADDAGNLRPSTGSVTSGSSP